MKNKMTAVEWLIDWLMDNPITSDGFIEAMMKAKAMEKEQIAEAFNNSYWFIDGIEYYEKTYGK